MVQEQMKDKLNEYHKFNSAYISDYIKFADTKAGIALSLNLLLLGFLGKIAKEIGSQNLSISDVGIYLGIIFLVISAGLFILKILWPRYTTSTDEYLSWGGIATFSNSNDYIQRLHSKELEEFLEDLAKQNYELSKVAKSKYFFLKCAFIFLSLGSSIGLVSWFIS